jgi:hypothetical protein
MIKAILLFSLLILSFTLSQKISPIVQKEILKAGESKKIDIMILLEQADFQQLKHEGKNVEELSYEEKGHFVYNTVNFLIFNAYS